MPGCIKPQAKVAHFHLKMPEEKISCMKSSWIFLGCCKEKPFNLQVFDLRYLSIAQCSVTHCKRSLVADIFCCYKDCFLFAGKTHRKAKCPKNTLMKPRETGWRVMSVELLVKVAVGVTRGGCVVQLELRQTAHCWFSVHEELAFLYFYRSVSGFVWESNKCFLLSGAIHLTLNHLLPKSPVRMSKKKNTGVQEQENTPYFDLRWFMFDIIPSVYFISVNMVSVSQLFFSFVPGRTPAT